MSWTDRALLLRAALLLAQARWGLSAGALDLDRARALSDPAVALSPESRRAQLARAQAVTRFVQIAAARVPFRVACLHRSVVLWRLLRREGIACDLRLGARRGSGPFAAHAWVECAGVALGEDEAHLATFAPFAAAVVPASGVRDAGRP